MVILKSENRIKIKEVAELAVMAALMFVGKEMMNAIPNVHPVIPIIIFCVIVYGWKAMYPVIVFIILEISLYGLGVWSITYIYVWPLFVAVAMLFRKYNKIWIWSVLAGAFGLSFGLLTELPFFILNGFKAALANWIAGIPFDIAHCVSAAILTLIIVPVLLKIRRRIGTL